VCEIQYILIPLSIIQQLHSCLGQTTELPVARTTQHSINKRQLIGKGRKIKRQ